MQGQKIELWLITVTHSKKKKKFTSKSTIVFTVQS